VSARLNPEDNDPDAQGGWRALAGMLRQPSLAWFVKYDTSATPNGGFCGHVNPSKGLT
jgi:hypothetical protein